MARGLLSSSRGGVLVGVICLVLVSLSEGIHATDRAGRTRGIRLPQAAFREVPWGQRGSESSHKCAMRLRGGGIFTQIDEAGASCFGRTMWSIVKSALGLSSKPKNTPAEDLAELQVASLCSALSPPPGPASVPLLRPLNRSVIFSFTGGSSCHGRSFGPTTGCSVRSRCHEHDPLTPRQEAETSPSPSLTLHAPLRDRLSPADTGPLIRP